MDFIDKKEKLADLIENYINQPETLQELKEYVLELEKDPEFKDKQLFTSIFADIRNYISELSRKELKQRVMMIRGFLE